MSGWNWGQILGTIGGGAGGFFLGGPAGAMAGAGLGSRLFAGQDPTMKQYQDQWGRLGPTAWEKPGWIGDWGEKAGTMAHQSYDTALSSMLQRIAPPIAGRGMWGSPGVRGALGIEAAKPLQAALTQRLSGIDTHMAGLYGRAEQDWQNRELEKLLRQIGLTGQMGQQRSDMWGGIGDIAGTLGEAWGEKSGRTKKWGSWGW